MKTNRRLSVLWLCLLFSIVVCGANLWGQGASAIRGIVSDPSGLSIGGAEIVATNLDTGSEYRTTSGDGGNYSLPALPLGNYSVQVAHSGFQTFVNSSVQVNVATTSRLDVQLQVAGGRESVNVSATPPILETESNSTSTVVDERQIQELPLKMQGTSVHVEQFVFLTPGTVTDRGEVGPPFNHQINGTQAFSRELEVDGISLSTRSDDSMIFVSPVLGSVGEFKVISSNPSAEYGHSSGGQEVYSMKFGGREYHGTLFEYFRNEALDARGFFSPTVPVAKMNQFGGTFGGPVGIPRVGKVRETFFFFAYQGFRFKSGSPSITTVPTPAMKQGDFSAYPFPIYDPATTAPDGLGGFTRQQINCNGVLNVICPDRFSSVGAQLISFFPDPNRPGDLGGITNNYLGQTLGSSTVNTWSLKVNSRLSTRQTISGTYDRGRWVNANFGVLPRPFQGGDQPQLTEYGILNHTFTITPSLVNQFAAGYQRTDNRGTPPPDPRNFLNELGITGVPGNPPQFPSVSLAGPIRNEGFGVFAPFANPEQSYQFRDDITYIRGKHSLKLGFDHRRVQGGRADTSRVNFNFSFLETSLPNASNRNDTGSALASMMLGAVDFASLGFTPTRSGFRWRYYGGYIQDDIKLTSKLTVNAGVRWEAFLPPFETYDRMSNFDPTEPNPGAGGIPGALVFAGTGPGLSGQRRFADTVWNNFGPRLGLAYMWNSKTVMRAGFGITYSQNSALGSARFPSTLGFNLGSFETGAQIGSQDGGVTPAFFIDNGYPQNFVLPPKIDPSFANGQNVTFTPRDGYRPPYLTSWNFSLQRELARDTVLDVAYVGNKGTHLLSFLDAPNQLNPGFLGLGDLLTQDVASPEAAAAGIFAPFPGFTGTVAQALRPFPQYRTITVQAEPDGTSSYQALQVKLDKKYSENLNFLVAYTFSKTITDADSALTFVSGPSHQNGYDKRVERTIAMHDATHNLVLSYVYKLPVGRGKRYLNRGGVLDKFVGGWGIAGISTYQTGYPSGFLVSSSLPGIILSGSIRPDRVSGQPCRGSSGPGGFDPNRDKWFNPAAFSEPASFSFGNAAPRLNDCRLPAWLNEDFSILKSIRVDERRSFEFRAEFFNVFNRTVFDFPDADAASPTFGQLFGQSNPPRQIQFVLKFQF
jgi:Carboxypeptidase regulatory-like domain